MSKPLSWRQRVKLFRFLARDSIVVFTKAMHAAALAFGNSIAEQAGMIQGVPLGVMDGEEIVTSNSKLDDLIRSLHANPVSEPAIESKLRVVNRWKLRGNGRHCGTVFVLENKETKKRKAHVTRESPIGAHLNYALGTIGKRLQYTPLKAEIRARDELLKILNPQQQKQYLLTDTICETGKSGVIYLLRKNRPTLSLGRHGRGEEPLVALCMHPDAYYNNSWAGSLPPSDEVKAHLFYIRGDEYGFWKKCNHIPLDQPNSGV